MNQKSVFHKQELSSIGTAVNPMAFHKQDLVNIFTRGKNKFFIVNVPEFEDLELDSMGPWIKSAIDALSINISGETSYILVDQHYYTAFYFGPRSTFGKYLNLGHKIYSVGGLDFILFDFSKPSLEDIMDLFP